MKYFIILAIVLIAIFVTGLMIRQRHNKEIKRLEHTKHQIQNKPILEELTKVKQLNMNGQTEEMFERWRTTWTEVMDIHMVKIDQMLFDAEEMVDHFRFSRATAIEKEIQNHIHSCDKQMTGILEELEQLIGSEEKNRIEIEQLRENYRLARKNLLAHQHVYGVSGKPLEQRIAQFVPLFEQYDELTETGNYLQAREIVITLMELGSRTFPLMHDIPSLLVELQTKIPATIQELRNGQSEMEDQTYSLMHLEITTQLVAIEEELKEMMDKVAELEIGDLQLRVEQITEELDGFYDLLEKEVRAKHFIETTREQTASRLENVVNITRETSEEAVFVQQSYRLNEQKAEIPQNCLKQLELLRKRVEALNEKVAEDKIAYSILQDELKTIQLEVELLFEEQDEFSAGLKTLRLDENIARSKLDELKKHLHDSDRLLQKANIPGIPADMDARLEEAEEHLYVVVQSLQEVPLNMNAVNMHLDKAEKSIAEVADKAHEILENVLLIERIIQYGNRHRAVHPKMHQRLLEAEDAFRQLRFSKALEDAATAVEEVEPGAMKRIEMLVKQEAWDA